MSLAAHPGRSLDKNRRPAVSMWTLARGVRRSQRERARCRMFIRPEGQRLMIAGCVRRSTLLLLLAVLFATSAFAAPAELRIFLDADNDPSTGCRVITNLGNVDGVEAVYTTTYDTDAGGSLVVTGTSKASCAQPGTVNFTPPQQFDSGGWGVPADSDGNLNVETRIPAVQLPNGVRANMHWVFAGVQGTLLDTVRTDADGNKILFPETATHPHIAGPMGGRDIEMDGNVADWLPPPPP